MVPQVNFQAKSYHEMVNINASNVFEPPLLQHLTDDDIESIRSPVKFLHPCHNQAVEWHTKLVSEASLSVCGFTKGDGIICQKLRSRKVMKSYNNVAI